VGRRWVRDRGRVQNVLLGYGELVPRGRYPVAIVMLDVPAGAVDINVHPQKHEVRFADANAVCAALRHVVQAGVASAPWREEAGTASMVIATVAPPKLPFDGVVTQQSLEPRQWVRTLKQQIRDAEVRDEVPLAEGSAPVVTPGFFATLRFIGQLDLTYLVCEAQGELVLLDQHVAHEGVELARLRARGERDVATQRMLFPTTLEVAPELVELAAGLAGGLARVGYEVEAFGKTTLALKAVPGGIRHGDPAQLLRSLLDQWGEDGAPSEAEILDRVLAAIACHSVVRAGDRLSTSEAEALLRAMDGADFTGKGPHGRPVLLRVPLSEIARRFGR
jgi:DNA mismatch repair protein MutL